jgi:hypothetical protein
VNQSYYLNLLSVVEYRCNKFTFLGVNMTHHRLGFSLDLFSLQKILTILSMVELVWVLRSKPNPSRDEGFSLFILLKIVFLNDINIGEWHPKV